MASLAVLNVFLQTVAALLVWVAVYMAAFLGVVLCLVLGEGMYEVAKLSRSYAMAPSTNGKGFYVRMQHLTHWLPHFHHSA